jgi:2-dehydro-3-deoxyphosphogluconate aldolase/(4S)-4-hydroxy-2-oxoglutarate aldolase
MTREEVRTRIEETGIMPAIRVASAEDALFAAEAVTSGGIPIVELTMTVPGAIEVISDLVRRSPETVIGAGTVLDLEIARRCADAGVQFLTSTGLDLSIVEFAQGRDLVVIPGALTPTEVIMAWKAGSDFIKIFPCSQIGGAGYIRALKTPLPHVPLIASGGVNQQTAADFILAGADALGIGSDLIPHQAIERRQTDWIHELTRRFLKIVKDARSRKAGK